MKNRNSRLTRIENHPLYLRKKELKFLADIAIKSNTFDDFVQTLNNSDLDLLDDIFRDKHNDTIDFSAMSSEQLDRALNEPEYLQELHKLFPKDRSLAR